VLAVQLTEISGSPSTMIEHELEAVTFVGGAGGFGGGRVVVVVVVVVGGEVVVLGGEVVVVVVDGGLLPPCVVDVVVVDAGVVPAGVDVAGVDLGFSAAGVDSVVPVERFDAVAGRNVPVDDLAVAESPVAGLSDVVLRRAVPGAPEPDEEVDEDVAWLVAPGLRAEAADDAPAALEL
jgi:hypothetical protein